MRAVGNRTHPRTWRWPYSRRGSTGCSRRQLAEIGIRDRGIKRRVTNGHLHRIHPGVYAVGHPSLASEARWMAAVLACGKGAVLSHLDAAVLWKVYESQRARIHVTVLSRRQVQGLWIHRTRRLDPADVTLHEGIPVTS